MNGARISGHAIHPVAIVFPLALLAANVALDAHGLVTGRPRFAEAATFCLGAGAIAGIPASILGALDWLAYRRGSKPGRLATRHGLVNLGLLAAMTLAWLLRHDHAKSLPTAPALLLGLAAVAIAAYGFFLGWTLAEGRQGPGAAAPVSSLSR